SGPGVRSCGRLATGPAAVRGWIQPARCEAPVIWRTSPQSTGIKLSPAVGQTCLHGPLGPTGPSASHGAQLSENAKRLRCAGTYSRPELPDAVVGVAELSVHPYL